MRINERMDKEATRDLEGHIQIPNIQSSQLRKVCENIMNMITRPGYITPTYHNVGQLDKLITLDYWREYDGFNNAVSREGYFSAWYIHEATEPSWIGRAIETLRQRNYIFLNPEVEKNAQKAHENMAHAMKRG